MNEFIDYFKDLKKGSKAVKTVFNDDYLAFWDNYKNDNNQNITEPVLKMVMGLVYDPTINANVPGIVLGAGDGQGYMRAYIQKDADGFKLIYRISNTLVSGIKFDNTGKIFINDKEVAPLTDVVLKSQYNTAANLWNAKLADMTYDENNEKWWVGNNKIADGAVTDAKIDTISANKINGGTIQGVVFQTKYSSITWGTRLKIDNYGSNISFNYKDNQGGTEQARGAIEFSTTQMSIKPKGAATLSIGDYASVGATHTTYAIGTWDFSNCDPQGLSVYAKFA